jgi:type I restriction enzyme S subunit
MKKVHIKDLCELRYGKSLKKENRRGGSVPVYGSNGIVGYHDKPLVKKKTIIIGRKGSIGEVHFVKVPSWPIDTTYFVDFKVQDINIEWFYRILKTLRLNELNRSAAIPGLNRDDVYRLKIHRPAVDDQIRIATLLSRVEALIATRKNNLRLLDEFLKSIFLEMFVSDKRFAYRKIESIADKSKRYALSSGPFGSNLTSEHYVNSGVLVLRGTNISKGTLSLDDVKFVSEVKAKELSRSEIVPNDVVIVAVGSSGQALKVPQSLTRAIISQNFNKISPDLKLINPTYLEFCINSNFVQSQFRKNITDTVRTFLSLTKIKEVLIPYPPIVLQNKFASIVEKAESLKTLYQQSLSDLENLYAALSQKAFKGELDLSRIPLEKTAEETLSGTTSEPAGQIAKSDPTGETAAAGLL